MRFLRWNELTDKERSTIRKKYKENLENLNADNYKWLFARQQNTMWEALYGKEVILTEETSF